MQLNLLKLANVLNPVKPKSHALVLQLQLLLTKMNQNLLKYPMSTVLLKIKRKGKFRIRKANGRLMWTSKVTK